MAKQKDYGYYGQSPYGAAGYQQPAGYPMGGQGYSPMNGVQGAAGYPPAQPFAGGASPYGTPSMPSGGPMTGAGQVPGMLPIEESYIENILRLNKGKRATVYMTFENNREWNAKVFKGIIEAAGRDHVVLSDPETGMRYLLLMIYLDYVTFDEEIEYEYPYGAGAGMAQYSPRKK